jgi:hypothetical protein
MSNANYDNMPDDQIKPPKRMPNTEWDKYLIDIIKGKKK